MTQNQPDQPVRKRSRSPFLWPGIILVLACAYAGSSFYGAMWWGEQLEQEYSSQKRQLDTARRRYNSAIQQVEISGTYLERYFSLQQQGLIGPIDRLAWSDGLKRIADSMALSGMSLNFSAAEQLSHKMKQQFEAREPIYNSFGMTLSFSGQHEGDLLMLLAQLDNQISPMYFTRRCRLESGLSEDEPPGYSEHGNVSFDCELRLLQVVPRGR